MSWINEHRNGSRAAALIVLAVAMTGPWFFDRLYVPAQYPCTYRLRGDFCGMPTSGTYLFGAVGEIFHRSRELLSGAIGFGEWARGFLIGLFLSLFVLPFFSTLLVVLRKDQRRWQVFNMIAWGLAAGAGLFIGLFNCPRLFWVLWGIWLYVGLAAAVVTVELLAIRSPGV